MTIKNIKEERGTFNAGHQVLIAGSSEYEPTFASDSRIDINPNLIARATGLLRCTPVDIRLTLPDPRDSRLILLARSQGPRFPRLVRSCRVSLGCGGDWGLVG